MDSQACGSPVRDPNPDIWSIVCICLFGILLVLCCYSEGGQGLVTNVCQMPNNRQFLGGISGGLWNHTAPLQSLSLGVLLDPCTHRAYFWVLFITQIQNA